MGAKSGSGIIAILVADHEAIVRNLRNQISVFGNEQQDLGTSDFVTSLMQVHEKAAWLLRAHLDKSQWSAQGEKVQFEAKDVH